MVGVKKIFMVVVKGVVKIVVVKGKGFVRGVFKLVFMVIKRSVLGIIFFGVSVFKFIKGVGVKKMIMII